MTNHFGNVGRSVANMGAVVAPFACGGCIIGLLAVAQSTGWGYVHIAVFGVVCAIMGAAVDRAWHE